MRFRAQHAVAAGKFARSPRLWASSGDQGGTHAVEKGPRVVMQNAAREPDVDPAESWQNRIPLNVLCPLLRICPMVGTLEIDCGRGNSALINQLCRQTGLYPLGT